MTPSYGFYGAAQLLQMMHLLAEHDFFLRRTRVNAGFLKDINQTDPVMVDAGWKLVGPHGTIVPCCIELHWNRKAVAEAEAKNADKRAVASLSAQPPALTAAFTKCLTHEEEMPFPSLA